MLIKRPIYNHKLRCVAFEILAEQKIVQLDNIKSLLPDLIRNSESNLPLFIPYELKSIIEDEMNQFDNPIILKLNASDIETRYTVEEIKSSCFSIALLITGTKQLPWLNLAEYIALSEQLMDTQNISKIIEFSQQHKRKIIGYGLAKPISFKKCKQMKLDYYCGDFLFIPQDVHNNEIAGSKLNLLQLIHLLHLSDCDFNALSDLIQKDPLLSYQLLKVANSVIYSGNQQVDSIDHAIQRMGVINIKNWVMLLSIKNISDKPIELIESGLIRAHMARVLAQLHPQLNSQGAYTAGLLSILDAVLNKPMGELISKIKLSDDVHSALLERDGPLGEILNCVIHYEEGAWDEINDQDFDTVDLSKLYIDTLGVVTQETKKFMH